MSAAIMATYTALASLITIWNCVGRELVGKWKVRVNFRILPGLTSPRKNRGEVSFKLSKKPLIPYVGMVEGAGRTGALAVEP